jgi:copper chaperone CopZ
MLCAMRFALAAVILACALGSGAASARAGDAAVEALPAGRYAVPVKGMLCVVDARAIAAEWAKLPAVENASVDYESGRATVTVRLGKTLKVSALLKALRRAERLADLGARYELGAPAYVP